MSAEPLFFNMGDMDFIYPLDREEIRKTFRLITGGKEYGEAVDAEKPATELRRARSVIFGRGGQGMLRHQRRWAR